jgi:hypothetical protein
MAIEKDNQPTEDTLPETEATVELPGEEGGEAVVAINEDGTTQLNPEVEAESEEDFYSNLAETIDERVLMKLGTELVQMYKSDRESRQDWEDQYVKGLEFLTTNYTAVTKPFQGHRPLRIHYYLKLLHNFKHKHLKNYFHLKDQ